MITVACVLKSGGDVYSPEWVKKLYKMVKLNTTKEFQMVCLTDEDFKLPNIKNIPLTDNLKGWWSKVELFKLQGPLVYLDLDTLILGNIDGLMESCIRKDRFNMLSPFNPKEKWASGIMSWGVEPLKIYTNFQLSDMALKWDQRFISMAADNVGYNVKAIQRFQLGIFSWRECTETEPPDGARIICFHGRFKQHNCDWDWVKEIWG